MPIVDCFYRIDDNKTVFSTFTKSESYITDSVRKLIKNRIDISKKLFQKRPELYTSNRLILKFNIENNYQYTFKIYKNYNAPITENDFNGFTLYSYTDLFKLQTSFNYSYSSVLYTQFGMKLFLDKFHLGCIDEFIYPRLHNSYVTSGKGYGGYGKFIKEIHFYHTKKLSDKVRELLDEYRPKYNNHLREIFNQLAYRLW